MYTRTQPFLLLTLITALLTKEAHGVLTKIGARDEPFLNEIQIRCTDNGGVLLTTDNLALRRTVLVDGQLNTQPFTDIIISIGVIRFDVDPTIEGNYTCVDQDTDTVASNSVIVVGQYIHVGIIVLCVMLGSCNVLIKVSKAIQLLVLAFTKQGLNEVLTLVDNWL